MPGNKNSGRKRNVADVSRVQEVVPSTNMKKKVGRPKKKDAISSELDNIQGNIVTVAPDVANDSTAQSSSTLSRKDSLNFYDLKKRSRKTTATYESLLGPSLSVFPSSKLPHQRAILQRYRFLITGH